MSRPLPAGLSAAQRAFVDAARSMGALAPDRAQPLTALPRLSGRELDALVAQGLVREAASWTYYVFESNAPAAPAPSPWPVVPPRRRVMGGLVRLIFWVALLLVPMLAILLLSASALPAQVSELTVGTRVRVRAPDAVAGRLTGVIVGQGGGTWRFFGVLFSEHWERIALPRLAIGPRRDGAMQVGLAWRW